MIKPFDSQVMSDVSTSRVLADWCAGLRVADIPAEVLAALPLRILDTTGLIIAGTVTPAGRYASDYARTFTAPAESSLCGSRDRVPASMAALAHGVAAHCRDFDDTYVDSVVHPGSMINSALLALAEKTDASSDDFNAAIVAGYEVAARVGAVAGRKFHARSLHATGIVGPIACAAAAGRLLRLSGQQISWAMGLAASMSGGLMAFLMDGGWSKWLHVGWAAHGGIVASDLAARDFRGPEHVLNGKHDLYSALLAGEALDRSLICTGLGTTWQGSLAQFKYYPCAHVIQPYIDAVLEIVRRHDLAAADIAGIDCTIAPWAAAIVCEPREAKLRFDSELEAIASLPYQLAVAAIDRRVDLQALEPTSRSRPDLADFAHRVTHRLDASLGQTFDGSVEIRTKSGKMHLAKADLAHASLPKLLEKFYSIARPLVGVQRAEALSQEILRGDEPLWKPASRAFAQIPPEAR